VDITLFCKNYESQFILVQVYVDDIIFSATNEIFCKDFFKLMETEFEMSVMGELKFFLRLQIMQTPNGIYIRQTKYVKDLLKKFNMNDAKEMKTTMHPTTYLGLDEESIKVNETQCREMIESLFYLPASKPDIMFSVCLCSRFQQEQREVHLILVKHIFRYLIETPNLGILLKRRENFKLRSLCDADYASDKVEKKNTRESCHFIGGNLVAWICKKQGLTTFFTAKAKYMSVSSYCAQFLWIKNQLEDYNIYESKIPIYCDNKVVISLSKNPIICYNILI